MAYMGKAQALRAQGHRQESKRLLQAALHHVEKSNLQVYRADLLLALANRAIRQTQTEEAKALLAQAADSATQARMPRPYAESQLRMTELHMAEGDFKAAEISMKKCLAASRELVDMYFLPQHLAMAAEIETRLHNFKSANSYYEEAEELVESMLLNVPSAEVKASLIATMDQVFRGHFRLALEDEKNMPGAFRILEQVRGRVVADNLRAKPSQESAEGTSAVNREISKIQNALLRTTSIEKRHALVARLQNAEQQIDLTTLSREKTRYSIHGTPVQLAALQEKLRPSEVLLEYVIDDPHSFCIAITKETAKSYRLPGKTFTSPMIDRYLAATRAMRDPAEAKELYKALFAPVAEFDKKTEIIIVPDGKLGFLPFEAFR